MRSQSPPEYPKKSLLISTVAISKCISLYPLANVVGQINLSGGFVQPDLNFCDEGLKAAPASMAELKSVQESDLSYCELYAHSG
jgi:hypothetical protein